MPENQPKRKNPHELFREIDMICEEVNNSATQIEQKMEISSPIQRVLKEQEEKNEQNESSNMRNCCLPTS